MDEIKKIIVEYLTNAKKSKHYFKDLEKAVKEKIPGVGLRDVKKACNELVNEGTVAYFMTGSTTMYCLASRQSETTTKDE